jgi:uncharacterized membrane protein YvbJ
MYCPFCGTDNPEDRKFCLACGTPLEEHTQKELPKDQKDLHLKIVRQDDAKIPEKESRKIKIQHKGETVNDQKSINIGRPEVSEKELFLDGSSDEEQSAKKHSIKREVDQGSQTENWFTEAKEESKDSSEPDL